tara:strand:- start:1305 stop:2771 length:1467 start_codon:yes stop_codon:yes gene_type:complete
LIDTSFRNSHDADGYHTPVFLNIADPQIRNFCVELSAHLDNLSQKKLQANFTNGCVTLSNCDAIRALVAFDPGNKVMVPIKSMLLKMAIQAQYEAGGSAFVALSVCLEIIANISKAHHSGANINRLKMYSINPILSRIADYSRATTHLDVQEILKNLIGDDLAIALALTAAELAGPNGQIFVDEKCNTATHVELKAGYNFDCSIVPTFAAATNIQAWEYSHVKCIVIDGIIESVSEIHHLLEALNKTQVPAALFTRGFSQEVLATLSTNALRGTLNVVPIIVGYTAEHVNMLKDIAVACNTDVVSSLKGELISSIDIESMPTIDKVKAACGYVIISHRSSEYAVRLHMKNLREQKQGIEDSQQYVGIKTEKAKLLDKRIKALSSNCANIGLGPDLKIKKGITHDRLESAIMILGEAARFGKISIDDIQSAVLQGSDCHDPIHTGLLKSIAKIKKTAPVISVSSALTGIKRGIECALAISSVGAILLKQ